MRQIGLFAVGGVVVLTLLAYTTTYQVRFTDAAVLTRFGRADQGSVKTEPGLKFKWPYPVESVTTYDTRPRISEVKLETQQTKDSRQIVVESYCVWRVSDPLKFFQRFSRDGSRATDHFRTADETVKSNLRSAMGAVSQFEMSRLFGPDPSIDGLGELESAVLSSLKSKGEQDSLATWGIEVMDVGISQVVLPQETTTKVFERMAQQRDKLASEITSKAQAEAEGIRSRAEQDAKRIEAFTLQLAAEIRQKGDEEARQYYDMMQGNPELAVLLVETQMLREAYGRRGTTLVLPWNLPGLRLLKPDAHRSVLRDGKIVPPDAPIALPAKSEEQR